MNERKNFDCQERTKQFQFRFKKKIPLELTKFQKSVQDL